MIFTSCLQTPHPAPGSGLKAPCGRFCHLPVGVGTTFQKPQERSIAYSGGPRSGEATARPGRSPVLPHDQGAPVGSAEYHLRPLVFARVYPSLTGKIVFRPKAHSSPNHHRSICVDVVLFGGGVFAGVTGLR